jgi:hypothetical protein
MLLHVHTKCGIKSETWFSQAVAALDSAAVWEHSRSTPRNDSYIYSGRSKTGLLPHIVMCFRRSVVEWLGRLAQDQKIPGSMTQKLDGLFVT